MESQEIICLTCRTSPAMFVCVCSAEPVFICRECFNSHMTSHSKDFSPVSLSRLRIISEEEQLSTYGENLAQRVEVGSALYRYKEKVLDLQRRSELSRNTLTNQLQTAYEVSSAKYDKILVSISKCFENLYELSLNRQVEKMNLVYKSFMQDSLSELVEYCPNLSFDDSEVTESIGRIFSFGYERISTKELTAKYEESHRIVDDLAKRLNEKDVVISELTKQLETLKQENADCLQKYQEEEEKHDIDLARLNNYKIMERSNYQFLFKNPFIYIAKNSSSTLLQYDCFTNKTSHFDLSTNFTFNVTSTCIIPGGDVFIAGCTNPNSKRAFIFKIANSSLLELEEMSVARYAHGMVWYRDWVYALGGMNVSKAERFSLVHMIWDQLPNDMNEARYCFCAVPVNDRIYCIGGESTNTVEMLDLNSLTFSYLSVTVDYDTAVASMTNDKIYILSKNHFYIMNNEMKQLAKHENCCNNPKLTLCNTYTRSDCMIYFNSQIKLHRVEFLKFNNRDLKFSDRIQ